MLGYEELHSPHLFLLDYFSEGFRLALGLSSAGLHPSQGSTRGKRGVSQELLSREGWDLVSRLLAAGRNTMLGVALLP